jgi:flagellar biosynthesis protein FliR
VTLPVLDLHFLELLLLASVRIVAFLVVAPPFAHAAIPLRIKAMLGVGLALAVSARFDAHSVELDTAGFIGALLFELAHGLLLGVLVMIVFSAIQSAGSLVDLFGGFQLAQAYDPQSQVNGAQFTRLFQMTAMVLLFSTDGYQLVLGGLARSFQAMPVGTLFGMPDSGTALIDSVGQSFLAALQIAGPLVLVLVLADVGLGLVSRVSPALNAFALGYPLKILITVAFAGTIFLALPSIVASLTGDALQLVLGVSS